MSFCPSLQGSNLESQGKEKKIIQKRTLSFHLEILVVRKPKLLRALRVSKLNGAQSAGMIFCVVRISCIFPTQKKSILLITKCKYDVFCITPSTVVSKLAKICKASDCSDLCSAPHFWRENSNFSGQKQPQLAPLAFATKMRFLLCFEPLCPNFHFFFNACFH